MRAELRDSLQELWDASLHERALLVQRSAAPVLDGILAAQQRSTTKIRFHLAPKSGIEMP